MNVKIILTIASALALASCQTSETASLPDYDERPDNQLPRLERPAWPSYDIDNDRSFAAFSDVQTARKGEGHQLFDENGQMLRGAYTLYRCKDATYVAYDSPVPQEQDWFFYRWMEGSKIIDADTGDQYMIRSLEHFPLNQFFWIYGQSGHTIRIIAVYPPLPLTVRRVQLFEASGPSRKWFDGNGYCTRAYDIEDLRSVPQEPEKQGRVIY